MRLAKLWARRCTTYVFLLFLKPIWMTLLNMLSPEVLLLEKLLTFWDTASELMLILLLDKLDQFYLRSLFGRHATKLSNISRIRIQDLHKLFFESLDPIKCALKLLLGLCSYTVSLELSITLRRKCTR